MSKPNVGMVIKVWELCQQHKNGRNIRFKKKYSEFFQNFNWKSTAPSSGHFCRLADMDEVWELSLEASDSSRNSIILSFPFCFYICQKIIWHIGCQAIQTNNFYTSYIRHKDFRPSPSSVTLDPGFWNGVDWRALQAWWKTNLLNCQN